jgi:hypothetical protein
MRRCQGSILLAVLLWSCQLLAGQYFLATNGSDANSGTREAPWATFNHAIWKLVPGDTLLVREGRYSEGEVWIRKARGMGGADGRYVTLMAYPGEKVELDGERLMIVDANYIRIQGFTFLNTYSLRMPYTGSPDARNYVEVLNNRFSGHFLIPLEFSGNHSLIEGNVFDNKNGDSHAIYLHYGRDNVVRKNRILGTYKYGIHVYDEHKDGDEPGFVREYHNILIEENYVANCQTRAGIILGTSADSPTPGVIMDSVIIRRNIVASNGTHGIYLKAWEGKISHVEIYNNTIYQNAADGIQIVNAQDVHIFNNIIVTSGGYHIRADDYSTPLSAERNLFWPSPARLDGPQVGNSLIADPLFVSTGEDGFQLQPASPARDAGLPNGMDFQGSAPDLGAREYMQTAAIHTGDAAAPDEYMMVRTYPNPFKASTTISCYLDRPREIEADIFDALGRRIARISHGSRPAGWLALAWDGRNSAGDPAPSGIYLCRIGDADRFAVQKILLIR